MVELGRGLHAAPDYLSILRVEEAREGLIHNHLKFTIVPLLGLHLLVLDDWRHLREQRCTMIILSEDIVGLGLGGLRDEG